MSEPNGTATAYVRNKTFWAMREVTMQHRYDNDLNDRKVFFDVARDGAVVPVIPARYWFGSWYWPRTGDDYFVVTFISGEQVFDVRNGLYESETGKIIKVSNAEICYTLHKEHNGAAINFSIEDDDRRGFKLHMQVVAAHGNILDECTFACASTRTERSQDRSADELRKIARQSCRLSKKRPFYVIAHECNTPDKVEQAVTHGANMVECDVHYDDLGGASKAWNVRHDPAMFEKHVPLKVWLGHLLVLQERGLLKKLTAIIFDIKHYGEISSLYQTARAYVPEDIAIIVSVGELQHARCLLPVRSIMSPRDGFAIDYENDAGAVEAFFRDNDITNCWFGNGITRLWRDGGNIQESYRDAGERRNDTGILKAVYGWTFIDLDVIHGFIRAADSGHDTALDGVMIELAALERLDWPNIANGLRLVASAQRGDPLFQAFCHQPG